MSIRFCLSSCALCQHHVCHGSGKVYCSLLGYLSIPDKPCDSFSLLVHSSNT